MFCEAVRRGHLRVSVSGLYWRTPSQSSFFIGAAFGIGQRQVELCLQTERLRFVGFTVQGTRHITLKNCCKQKRTWMWDAGCGMWETSILSQLEPKSRRSSLHLVREICQHAWLPLATLAAPNARGNMVGWKPMTCSQLLVQTPFPSLGKLIESHLLCDCHSCICPGSFSIACELSTKNYSHLGGQFGKLKYQRQELGHF